MSTQQLLLSLVLATMVFTVSLELRLQDFKLVAQMPRAVVGGLVPQFVLLPVGTWLATLVLDLPPNTEAAMILVACCPGGSLSNYVTHYGRGNTALSISISAVAALMALVLTPFNFTWMVSSNPATASWLRQLDIDASAIWWSLLALLAVPMSLGLWANHRWPAVTTKLRKPLGRFSLFALFAFIVLGLVREIGSRRDGKWGQRLIKIRHLASDAMESLVTRAPREITAALPVLKLGAFGGRGPKRPDLAKDPDAGKLDRALVWGKLLAGSTPYAGGGDFYQAHKDAFDEVSNFLLAYTESLVVELKTLDFEKRPRAGLGNRTE